MFFAISIHPSALARSIRYAAEHHSRQLKSSALVGQIYIKEEDGVTLLWDGKSSHANFFDYKSDIVLLRGGYIAAPEFWAGE